MPAFMGIGVIVIERRLPPPAEFATLSLLGLGVGMAMWEGTAVGSPYASMCCMTSAACRTAVIYFSGKVQPIAPGQPAQCTAEPWAVMQIAAVDDQSDPAEYEHSMHSSS